MADQLGVKTVFECLEEGDKIVFVDVRGPEEVAVSRIRGAILVTASPASKSKGGWTIVRPIPPYAFISIGSLDGFFGAPASSTLRHVMAFCPIGFAIW